MVLLTSVLCCVRKRSSKKFIDKLRVHVQAGHGGEGKVRYGGQGGRGGDVVVVGEKGATLKMLAQKHPLKRFLAPNGDNSLARALLGQKGENLEIKVPLGVCVSNDQGALLGEVNNEGDRVLVARGGVGGGPTNNYMPQKGHQVDVMLDLKLIADIGLVGFPNAGKSTLLKALSRATPKVATYPFTTVTPQLGTMMYTDLRQITVADLPGLIEGAHANLGMGHSFLKHVERTRLLLFTVDTQGFRLSVDHTFRSALHTVLLLNKELELYRSDLVDKPAVLALNKMDLPDADRHYQTVVDGLSNVQESLLELPEQLRPQHVIKFDEILPICAKKKDNTGELKERLREVIDRHAQSEEEMSRQQEQAAAETQARLTEHHGRHLV